MHSTPPEAELAAINREIEHLETEQAVLEEQRKKRRKVVARAARRLRYLNCGARIEITRRSVAARADDFADRRAGRRCVHDVHPG